MEYEPDIKFLVHYNFKPDGFNDYKVFSSFELAKEFARSLNADYDIVAVDKRMPLLYYKPLDDDDIVKEND